MQELRIQQERSHNLWNSAARKFPPLDKAGSLVAAPEVDSEVESLRRTRKRLPRSAPAGTYV